LADYLNGTAVEPYINDLNSQHPFSGHKEKSYAKARGFFQVFSKEDILRITDLGHEPVSPDVIRKCQGRRDIHAVKIMYEGSHRGYIRGLECMKSIGINDLLKIEQVVADGIRDYWCIPNTESTLPATLLSNSSINVIVNWQGIRKPNEENRVNWYNNNIVAPLTSDIFRSLNKSLLADSFAILDELSKPFLTVHLRLGRIIARYHREAIEMPVLYQQMGDLTIDCVLYHINDIIYRNTIRSVLILDDFDEMEETIHPEMMFIKNRMQSQLHDAFGHMKEKGFNVFYTIDLLAARAGINPSENKTFATSLWKTLVNNSSQLPISTIGRDLVLLDMTLAAHGDYILRVGLSLFGDTICKLSAKAGSKGNCVSVLGTGEGFRHPTFQAAMRKDCPIQLRVYEKLFNQSVTLS
jgi:hypothetical protein